MGGKEAYLSRSRLWKIRYDEDLLGCGEGADHLADLEHELLDKRRLVRRIVLELTEEGLD